MPGADEQVDVDTETDEEDQTSEKNEDPLSDVPDEDEEEKDEAGEDAEEKKRSEEKRSEIIQKMKWREKYLALKKEIEARDTTPSTKPDANQDPKEKAAKDFIRGAALEVLREERERERREEQTALEEFEAKVEETLESHPHIKESELLDVIEEYEVDPFVAAKIIERTRKQEKDGKPNLPKAKRGSSEAAPKKKPVDDEKPMWQIAQDLAREWKNNREWKNKS